MGYDAPFKGLRVVDLGQGLASPYCAMLLAQQGAEVVKVEPPEGDWSRILGITYGEHSAYSVAANLGKRSVALDLKAPEGAALLWQLIERADVLVEGFRPGVMDRLGFGYEAVAARAPRLLYLSVSGFGHRGPLADRPAMDPIIQAFTGLVLDNKGTNGVPRRVPISVVDMSAALYAFQAVSAALYARRDEPRGRHIRISLLEAAAALQTVRIMSSWLEGGSTPQSPSPSGAYECADGWIQLQVVQERDWASLCDALQRADLKDDPRFAGRAERIRNREELDQQLRPAFAALTRQELAARLAGSRVMCEPLNSHMDFLAHDHVDATGMVAWLPQPGLPQPVPVPNLPGAVPLQPGTARGHAPRRGEHTALVLAALGHSPEDIARLASRGIVAMPVAAEAGA